MVCLLIRDYVESVPCSDEWKIGVVTRPVLPRETLTLLWYCDYLS
jgi:hypothetical protein